MKSTRLYPRMAKYLLAHWPMVIAAFALSFLVVTFEGFSLWFGASLVQTLFEPNHIAMSKPEFTIQNINQILKYWTYLVIRKGNPLDSLKIVCGMMAFTFLMKNVLIYIKALVMARLNLFVVRDMRNQLYSHAMKLPVTYYDRNKSGNIISIIMNDVSTVNSSLSNTFDKLFMEPMRVVFWIGMLFVINVKLTLAVFIIFPIMGYLIATIGKSVKRRSKRVLEKIAGLQSILHETVMGVRAVKMFNMDEKESLKFKTENNKYIFHSYQSTTISSISSPLTEVLGVIVVIILLWYGGHQVLAKNGFGADDFVRFLIFLFSTFSPLKSISTINNTLQSGFAAAERVFGILDSPSETLNPVSKESIPKFDSRIEFAQVNFTYPGCNEEVLHDVNFTIDKGSIVAIVGSSGSGKSTILDLLPRFYEISSGKILIDNKDVREMDLAGLRHLYGIVSQETVLFNETIYNNIAYGSNETTDGQVIEAAKASNAWEFIEKLPKGLDTIIGERGVMLSGGQRQRLSIARALLRNPPILILDEATSALDTESERLVQSAINTLIENRTALVVAHRLSTIRHADKIIVLEDGKIVEQGTHDELLAIKNRYKYFHDIQFSSSPAAASQVV